MSSSGFASSTTNAADLPGGDRAERVESEDGGRRARRGDDRLRRRQAGLHQQLQLDERGEAEIAAAGDAAGVGAEPERDAGAIQRRDVPQQSPRALRWIPASRSRRPAALISSPDSVPRRSGSSSHAGFLP